MYPPSEARDVGAKYWYLRSYIGGILAIVTVTAVAFLPSQQLVRARLSNLGNIRLSGEELIEIFSASLAYDVTAPVHQQFTTYMATRLSYPPLLALLVGVGVLTLVLEWRSH